MPVCDCVLRWLACCSLLADGRCAQRGLSKFVKLPSGRSHRASLFGMSCIRALVVVSLQRWVLTALCCTVAALCCLVAALGARLRWAAELHWLHWSQGRRSDGVSAAAFLQWIYQDVWPIVHHSSALTGSRVRRLVAC